jgi:uncharacterized protein YecT (DUF1311 family)
MKIILLTFCLLLPVIKSYSQTKEYSRTYFDHSDKKLNEVYQELIDENSSDDIFIKNLKASQKAWIQFREAQFKLVYPDQTSVENSDALSNNELLYLAHLTDDRTRELLDLPQNFASKKIYVSDLDIIRSGHIHGGLGVDEPYWDSELVICGRRYIKGIVMHPENNRMDAFAEFLIPKKGGRLLGIAGWAEGGGAVYYKGKMRFRIFVDDKLLYGNEINGKECRGVDLDLGAGTVLRIETDEGSDNNYNDHMAFGDLRIEY